MGGARFWLDFLLANLPEHKRGGGGGKKNKNNTENGDAKVHNPKRLCGDSTREGGGKVDTLTREEPA